MNITEASLRRPVTTLMIFVCFLVIGIIAGQLLPLEFFPDIDIPFLFVEIPYPGSTPEEVERQIVRPAEEVLATISDIKRMSSNSHESGGWVRLEFEWGVDANLKALEAKEKLEGIRDVFPDDVERFFVRRWSPSDMSIMQLRISSNRDLSNSYDMLNRNLKRRLERIEGVSKIDLYGVDKKEIQIRLNVDRVIGHRVDIARLPDLLRRSNFLVTAGKVTDTGRRFVVRPMSEFQSVEDIGKLIVGEKNIRLEDIAEIRYDDPKRDYGRHLDRRYAIGLDVFKEAGANTVEVCERVIEEVEAIGTIPVMEGISIFYMDNQSESILSSLNELLKSGLLGGAMAVLILYFFLRRLSTTIIVALAVPFSILCTMAFMYFLGISLNILSMMGLMLAVGMLVDNAVVVTENMHRWQLRSGEKREGLLRGVEEVRLAITAGTLTTAIVFLPNIVSPQDQTAIYLKHVGITICIALGASLILAQTIVPLLVSRIKVPEVPKRTVIDKLVRQYHRFLVWTLNHRLATVGIILLLLISIALPMSQVKMNMFDEPEDRKIRLHYHINGNYAVEKVEEAVTVFEDYLFSHQEEFEIRSVYSYFTTGDAMSTILLEKGKKAKKSMQEIQEAIRKDLPRLPIANPSFEWQSGGGGGESVRIQLTGKSSAHLVELSHQVAWTLSQVKGLLDVRSEAESGHEEIQVVVDRDRAAQYGFSPGDVAGVVAAAMRGVNLRRFRDSEGEVIMRLEFQESDKQTLEDLQTLPLFNQDNRPVTLSSLADFHVRRGPNNIRRENRTTSMGVTANLDGLSVGEAKEKIGSVLKDFQFPAGYSWNYGQQFDYEEEALNTMLLNLGMALALIYFLMAALFESLIFPAAIWTQIIFAVVGVYWFFLITGTTMSIMGMIGILILIGVVVNNGIVLIDHVNQLRAMGKDRRTAILEAGRDRMRPILMTAGTTVLSLLPLCLVTTQIGGDGPPYFPLARAIVGGLTFSTLITLLVLPTIYLLLDDLRNWFRHILKLAK